MTFSNPELVQTIQQVLELLGTLAFAISGIRHAAAKRYDWFGGFVCGFSVAIGGGTMTSPFYIICTILAQVLVIMFAKSLVRLNNTWLVFDTLGLAFFTIAGMQKTLAYGHPFWVAIAMGCITGCAGGVLRDVLLNRTPEIFKKEIYAMASIAGGLIYWLMAILHFNAGITAIVVFFIIITIRFLSLRYHISLPRLKDDNE